MTKREQGLLKFIGDTPPLLSLLYDINLLPEQCKIGSKERGYMFLVAAHWQAAFHNLKVATKIVAGAAAKIRPPGA